MALPRHAVEDLDEAACRLLLRGALVGRVAFTDRALPRVLPVYYMLRGDEVIVARRRGATLEIRPGEVVAFEIDHYDPVGRNGWCVSLVGTSRLVTNPDEDRRVGLLRYRPLELR